MSLYHESYIKFVKDILFLITLSRSGKHVILRYSIVSALNVYYTLKENTILVLIIYAT